MQRGGEQRPGGTEGGTRVRTKKVRGKGKREDNRGGRGRVGRTGEKRGASRVEVTRKREQRCENSRAKTTVKEMGEKRMTKGNEEGELRREEDGTMEFTTNETFEGPGRVEGERRDVAVGVEGFGVGGEGEAVSEGEGDGFEGKKVEEDEGAVRAFVFEAEVSVESVKDVAEEIKGGRIKGREDIIDIEEGGGEVRV